MVQEQKEQKRSLLRLLWRYRGPLAAALLVLLAVLLGSAWNHQREMSRQMQLQERLIKALQENSPEEGFLREGTPTVTSQQVSQRLNSLQELVTKEYLYTNADQYENQNQVKIRDWDINVPLTSKSFLLAYDGRIKAGVDLSKAQIDVDQEQRTVTIVLPGSEITSHEIFEDDIRVFNERDSLFNKITIENYNEFVSGQKQVMEQRAIDMGLLEGADREARTELRAFLSLLPGMEDYRLEIK